MSENSYQVYDSTSATWAAMYRAMDAAKESISIAMFIFLDDEIGKLFFELLQAKARSGVEVRIVVDKYGSFWLSRERIVKLHSAGVDIQIFNERRGKTNWWRRIYARLHKKIIVIDRTIGFIGGVNIQGVMRHWLDINLEIRGPAVNLLARSFARSYIVSGGEGKNVSHLFVRRNENTEVLPEVEMIADNPNPLFSHARQRYTEILRKAKERVIFFSPYIYPDRHFLRALKRACQRKIQVDVIVPKFTDNALATYGGYHFLPALARYGVHIYLFPQMMHGKGMVIDDDAVVIGSTNLDQSSFYDNYEANVLVRDINLTKRVKEIATRWIAASEPFIGKKWKERGLFERWKERMSFYLFRLWHRRPV